MPKDQKTQTYSKSISDFPSTTDALVWYLEGERKAASESKRQVSKLSNRSEKVTISLISSLQK